MSGQRFSLKPFPSTGLQMDLKIAGSMERRPDKLSISYLLSGAIEKLVLPTPAETRLRKNGLWEETCLEFFLGVKGSERYREFNLSPAGHWNVYRFESYRQGMREDRAFSSLDVVIQNGPGSLLLSLGFEADVVMPQELFPADALQVGISAVIKTRDGRITYWALAHPGPQADFHRRDSFIIEL